MAWLVAGIVALATTWVVGGDLAALHRRARDLGPDVRVVLAARDVPIGTVLRASDLRVVVRPASTIAPDAIHEVAGAIGRVVASAVLGDDAVRARALAPADRHGLDAVIPLGKGGIHIAVKDEFRPAVGAVVDIFAAFDTRAAATRVASGAQVLAVDESGITVLVDDAEVPPVAFAALTGAVAVVLAAPERAAG